MTCLFSLTFVVAFLIWMILFIVICKMLYYVMV